MEKSSWSCWSTLGLFFFFFFSSPLLCSSSSWSWFWWSCWCWWERMQGKGSLLIALQTHIKCWEKLREWKKEKGRKERNTKMQWRGEAWNKKERSCQGINTRNYISIKFLYRRPVRGALCVSGAEDEDEKKDHKEDHKKEEEEGGGMMCQMPVSFSQFYLDCALLFCQTSLSYSSCLFPCGSKISLYPWLSVSVLPLLLLPESSRWRDRTGGKKFCHKRRRERQTQLTASGTTRKRKTRNSTGLSNNPLRVFSFLESAFDLNASKSSVFTLCIRFFSP